MARSAGRGGGGGSGTRKYVLLAPLYLGLMVAMHTILFGVSYHLWRDVYGEDAWGPDATLVTRQA